MNTVDTMNNPCTPMRDVMEAVRSQSSDAYRWIRKGIDWAKADTASMADVTLFTFSDWTGEAEEGLSLTLDGVTCGIEMEYTVTLRETGNHRVAVEVAADDAEDGFRVCSQSITRPLSDFAYTVAEPSSIVADDVAHMLTMAVVDAFHRVRRL